MAELQRETATYDPDLPHDFLRAPDNDNECALCDRLRKDELHLMEPPRQRASSPDLLLRELGTPVGREWS